MKLLRLSTQLHKWIALVVGIQVLFWVAGGLVMTAIPIETVRSEHHLAPVTPKPLAVVDEGPLVLVETRKDLSQIKLPFETSLPSQPQS